MSSTFINNKSTQEEVIIQGTIRILRQTCMEAAPNVSLFVFVIWWTTLG